VSQQITNRSFDDLARALAEGSLSRRRALKLFAGTALAALIPSRALADDDCVRVCHVPRTSTGDCDEANAETRCVSRRERRRHLENHPCDCRGSCRNCLTPECLPNSDSSRCSADSECCSGICNTTITGSCGPCRESDASCTSGSDCCSGNCDSNSGTCKPTGAGPNLVRCLCSDGAEIDACASIDCSGLAQDEFCGSVCATHGGVSATACLFDDPSCVTA
jgi:hypothetical protein